MAGRSKNIIISTPQQEFTSTDGQTVFTVTSFDVGTDPKIYSGNGQLMGEDEYVRDTVDTQKFTMNVGRDEGELVRITN